MEKKITGMGNSLWILVQLTPCYVIKALVDYENANRPCLCTHSTEVCANTDTHLHSAIMQNMHKCVHMLHADE